MALGFCLAITGLKVHGWLPHDMSEAPAPVTTQRLRFIDMARAVAILLMLEGHFIDVTLADAWRVKSHPVYAVWMHFRGLAAPAFFCATGLVFAYLLSGIREESFFGAVRVRRGLRRVVELIFWGYLLQINLRTLNAGNWAWTQAFHVLQCIACGLIVMILLFAALRRAGHRILVATLLVCGFGNFLLSVLLANAAGTVPAGAPAWLQNTLNGPYSVFPLAPWLAFTLYGAAIGVIVRHRRSGAAGAVNPLGFLVAGAILSQLGWGMDTVLGGFVLDLAGVRDPARLLPHFVHGRFGEVLLILAALTWIENRFRPDIPWLFAIGRNTFMIYVGHVILLYGGIFGIGLKSFWARSLNPWQAGFGAVAFCAFFALLAYWVEPLTARWRARRG